MNNALHASNPTLSATVSASAGTGKTWLLVTRLIRLLLAGARSDGILAVTFTRKAATEMQTRLNARLLEMASCEPAQLITLLQQIDAPTDEATLQRATTLYEDLLRSAFTVRTTTFHAFCQDILRRFPLEAGIPPGFELLESTAELQQAAWDALCAEANRAPDSDKARAIESLFESCNGLPSTQAALNSFVNHRSDWWAFTEFEKEPVRFAGDKLASQLNVSFDDDPVQDFFTAKLESALSEFVTLLQKHPGKKNSAYLDALAIARDHRIATWQRFNHCCQAFLTATGSPLARKESKAQGKSMGDSGQQRFLELHGEVCHAIEKTQATRNAIANLKRTCAWYQAGAALLNHYQHLKNEQRVLDFADLEWQAYCLLNHSDNVHWIQYKLDQRIDHLLIDEFQDTNPTQWRLILPLLEELAASEDERGRSVFLVGDNKQSIYRFRRADPALFDTAQDWLREQLHAVSQPLDTSWRSADAIMQFVNTVFGEGPLHQRLTHFSTHSTHHPQLWGQVEFLPLVETPADEQNATDEDQPPTMRNPLQTPRELPVDQRHFHEGKLIAERIEQLMSANTLAGHADNAQPLRYSDIIILMRNRTHAADYERALREASIPYLGADRGTLLDSQETRDLVNLLELLVTPFNNLALASLLRSPLFDCSNDDLMSLAMLKEGNWMERLDTLAPTLPKTHLLHRAQQLLNGWRERMGKTPVHDLLDRIFCEGDVLKRYHAAYPEHLRHRVEANLTRFIELALEIDSGRYPTIGHFVARLRALREKQQDAPDEGTPMQAGTRVRLMTIHASKGLEASVVFVADTSNAVSRNRAYEAMVDWPTDAPRPHCFLLTGKKEQRDPFTTAIQEQHAQAEAREDANLLYVAVTRAKQWLFISGCRPTRGNELGWYGLMQTAFAPKDETPDATQSTNKQEQTADTSRPQGATLGIVLTSGTPHIVAKQPVQTTTNIETAVTVTETVTETTAKTTAPQLTLNLEPTSATDTGIIAPSRIVGFSSNPTDTDPDGRTRGIAIHRMLQLLCQQAPNITQRVINELGLATNEDQILKWLDNAIGVFQAPAFAHLFDPKHFIDAYNEVPLHYNIDGQSVHGIIDRLVISDDCIWLVDYKTHRIGTHARNSAVLDALAEHYRPQLEYYRTGIESLWPGRRIEAGLLFTDGPIWKPLLASS